MLEILTYISLVAGGILILLLLLSILAGLDLDIDLPDTDAGGLGLVKGGLTFLSVGAWTVKLVLVTSTNPALAFVIGIVAGLVAVLVLAWVLGFLLKQQEEVNWQASDALFQPGKVYLRIPEQGTGLIHVTVNGARRELKAKSASGKILPTGTSILVDDLDGEVAIVSKRQEIN